MFDVEDLLARYAVAERSTPHLRVNFIASIDGAATHNGVSGPLNNALDKQVFTLLRMLSDVVIVGAGTVRDEGYGSLRVADAAVEWRVANGLPEHPVFAIVTSRAGMAPDSAIFSDAPVRPIIATHALAPDPAADPYRAQRLAALELAADVLVCGDTAVNPCALVDGLVERGLPQMLSEGGPHLLGSFIEADVVDELDLTVAPVLEGGDAMRITTGHAQRTRQMRLAHALTSEDMLFLRYLRAR